MRNILRFAVSYWVCGGLTRLEKPDFSTHKKTRRRARGMATPATTHILRVPMTGAVVVGHGSGRSGRSRARAGSSAVLGARPRRRRRDESGFWSELLAACASASFRRSRATRSGE